MFGELFEDALHDYPDLPLRHDAGYFVRLAGINPKVVSATIITKAPTQ